jgi:hypothetical protein
MKNVILFIWLALAVTLQAADRGTDPAGALACLQGLPEKYRDGVLKLSADNADPNPDAWDLSVQSGGDDSNIHNLTFAGGRITSDRRTLGFREIFSGAAPISLGKVEVDSRDAFAIAQRYARANRAMIGNVCFALEQRGATPIWSVWCYGPDGSYLGLMKLRATDGSVISNNAFPKKP